VSPKGRRYALKSSETKAFLNKVKEQLGANLCHFIDPKASIEAVEAGQREVLLVNKKPVLFRTGENVFPTLLFTEIISSLPKVIVDMGAIRHVCNGADIMAPGIVRFEGEFSKGELVLIVDVKHGKQLALGEAQLGSETAKNTKKGIVVRNIHYVSDEVWNVMKTLID
jgi:PUA domain protein